MKTASKILAKTRKNLKMEKRNKSWGGPFEKAILFMEVREEGKRHPLILPSATGFSIRGVAWK